MVEGPQILCAALVSKQEHCLERSSNLAAAEASLLVELNKWFEGFLSVDPKSPHTYQETSFIKMYRAGFQVNAIKRTVNCGNKINTFVVINFGERFKLERVGWQAINSKLELLCRTQQAKLRHSQHNDSFQCCSSAFREGLGPQAFRS